MPEQSQTILPRHISECEAAGILGISVKTLRKWRVAGSEIPYRKFGTAVRYSVADLEDYIAACTRTSTTNS